MPPLPDPVPIYNFKKILVAAMIVGIILFFAIFLFSIFFGEKEKPIIPTVPEPSKEKTMEDIINSLTAPVSNQEKTPVSEEIIKSLSAPVADDGASAVNSKNNKTSDPTPIPVPKEIIDSLTAPVK